MSVRVRVAARRGCLPHAASPAQVQARGARTGRLRRVVLGTLAAIAAVSTGTAPASAARAQAVSAPAMSLGFTDEGVLNLADADRDAHLALARASGATMWRFQLTWANIAPTPPPSDAVAADPDWPGYHWTAFDAKIKEIAAAGLTPLPYVFSAPAWAEGANRPAITPTVPAGSWRPNAAALRPFAAAMAKRYSGTHPDPAVPGTFLPAIHTWQVWNEPNLWLMISPQWVKVHGKWAAASPGIYRGLQNAVYAGVKSVDKTSTVITAGTAPYGDLTEGTLRIPPAMFWRDLFCESVGRKVTAKKCPPVSFDAIAHHPYSIGPPTGHAANADDVKIADTARITSLLGPALKRRTIRPAGPKPMWITETGWDSAPDPGGVTLSNQALYLEGALRVFANAGISHVLWFDLRDEAPSPVDGFASTYQSGLLLRGATPALDQPKPSLTAYRFPFTAATRKGRASLWGMAPAAGPVQIQSRAGLGNDAAPWTTVLTVKASADRSFKAKLNVAGPRELRAVTMTDASLPWPIR